MPQVLAAVSGGRLSLHGQPVPKRWTRLAVAAYAGSSTMTVMLSPSELAGWIPGREVMITSSTFNPEQVEYRRITAVDAGSGGQDAGTLQLTLDAPLTWDHAGDVFRLVCARVWLGVHSACWFARRHQPEQPKHVEKRASFRGDKQIVL